MSRWTVRVALAVGGVVAGAGGAAAQPLLPGGGGVPPPAFSPYLNLVGRGGVPGINYYGIVRPQIAARDAIFGLQAGVMQNRQAIAGLQTTGAPAAGLPGTGHMTSFLNTGGYFMSNGTGGAPPVAAGRMTPDLGGLGGASRMGLRPTNRVNAGGRR